MTIERLRAHYGFTRMPFSRQIAPGMLFAARAHAEATARIAWLMAESGIGVVTGEVGAGKTVAARAAVSGMDHSRHTVVYLHNPTVGARGMYAQIVAHLGAVPRYHKASLIPQCAELLAREHDERGKAVVLVVDEAHLLGAEQLEELRLMHSADMDARSPFACVLLGQPSLRRRLRLGSFAALDQRVALRYHLDGMSPEETAGYVRHHLGLAGRSDPLFSDDAVALVHQTSRGLPRAVNNLAVQSLVAAFADGKAMVDESSAKAAVVEVTGE